MFAIHLSFPKLCGLLLVVVSALSLSSFDKYEVYTGSVGTVVLIVFIAVGLFFFVTGFFGCCGAMRENYCMLFMYATIIFVLLLIEIAVGITAFLLQDDLSREIDRQMEEQMENYPNATEIEKGVFDDMQQALKCCGTKNYTDWFGLFGNTSNGVPESCCKQDTCDNTDIPEKESEAKEVIYVEGCAKTLKDLLREHMMTIIIICIVVGLIEITGIFCACCLMKSVKNEYEVV